MYIPTYARLHRTTRKARQHTVNMPSVLSVYGFEVRMVLHFVSNGMLILPARQVYQYKLSLVAYITKNSVFEQYLYMNYIHRRLVCQYIQARM